MNELPDWWPHKEPYAIGDCLELMKAIPDNSVDLVVTSPPYNLGQFSRNGGKNVYDNYQGNDMPESEYRKWVYEVFSECERIIKNTGAICWNMKYRFKDNVCILPNWILDNAKTSLRNQVIWKYNVYTDVCRNKFYPGYEVIFIMVKDTKQYYFNPEMATIGDVWRINPASMNENITGNDHPAPYPTELAQRCVESLSKPGDIVLDPFLGSGTLLLATRKTDRIGLGFEINLDYERIIRKRMMADTPKIETWFE